VIVMLSIVCFAGASARHVSLFLLVFVHGIAAHKVVDAHWSAAGNRTDPVSESPDSPAPADGSETACDAG
jgi:hypothetical protein